MLHVAGQSFGVLELLKRQAPRRLAYPAWARPACKAALISLAVLELHTLYLSGSFAPDLFVAFVAPASAILVAATLFAFRGSGLPLAYFALQAAGAGLAVYRTEFYKLTLAGHYLEYLLIMMPRCFYVGRDEFWSRLRGRKILFYGPLALIAAALTLLPSLDLLAAPGTGWVRPYVPRWLVAVFIWHYFVDAFLWRFKNDFYKRTTLPLYVRPWKEVSA